MIFAENIFSIVIIKNKPALTEKEKAERGEVDI